jgi:hypothetical protein
MLSVVANRYLTVANRYVTNRYCGVSLLINLIHQNQN